MISMTAFYVLGYYMWLSKITQDILHYLFDLPTKKTYVFIMTVYSLLCSVDACFYAVRHVETRSTN